MTDRGFLAFVVFESRFTAAVLAGSYDSFSELNSSEWLNQAVKINAVRRQRVHHLAKLMGNVRRYLWSTQRRPENVRG